MKLISPKVEAIYLPALDEVERIIDAAISQCYQTETREEGRAQSRIAAIIRSGHESTIEHCQLTFRITTDRAVSHELVRHRIGVSPSQESQRYCAYRDDVEFVIPHWLQHATAISREAWEDALCRSEGDYHELLNAHKISPQDARGVLPNATATHLVVTYNFRSLRHFFKLRLGPRAHPDMRHIASLMFDLVKDRYPYMFWDIGISEKERHNDWVIPRIKGE